MLRLILVILGIIFLGCGGDTESSSTYYIDGNGTIPPLEQNQTIKPDGNVQSVEVSDSGLLIMCNEGSSCTVTIGDNNGNLLEGNTGKTSVSGSNLDYTYWYQYNGGSCCITCGECADENITVPDINVTEVIPDCSSDFSGGVCSCDISNSFCGQISGS